jgi:hypothetical protein
MGTRTVSAWMSGQCELSSVESPVGGITVAKLIYVANTSLDGSARVPVPSGKPQKATQPAITRPERSGSAGASPA